MPRARVGQLQMYYELDGEGVPVVLIAGLTCDHTAWTPQLPDFRAAGFRCLAFDNRDVGQTDQSAGPYTIRDVAADTIGLMNELDLPTAHIVGASMGGMIAEELTLAHPDRVRSLTLVCTTAATDATLAAVVRAWRVLRPAVSPVELLVTISPWLFTYRSYAQADQMESFLQLARDNPFPQTPDGFRRQCDAILIHDAARRLGAVRAPTHVIVGAEDVLTPPRCSRELAQMIPGAKLTEAPAAGHGLFWEAVPVFNRAVIDFIENVERGPATRR